MSQQALVDELLDSHGWSEDDVQPWRKPKGWNLRAWNEMIDAVCRERLAREKESKVEAQPIFIGMPDTRDYIFDGHAGAGPSGAERWMNCTESLGAARAFLETLTPNQQKAYAQGSEAARQGTTAHAAAEAEVLFLLGEITQEERDSTLMELAINPVNESEAYDADMAEHVSVYVDLISQYLDEDDRKVLVEQRVEAVIPLTFKLPDGSDYYIVKGNGDCIILPSASEPTLTVVDYKHGEGLDVSVDGNPQVRVYGLGGLDLLTDADGNLTADIHEIEYVIVQPRLGGIKVWKESVDDLLDWRDDVLSPALTAALTGEGATFAPSDETCHWCPARGGCAALAEQRMAAARELFDVITEAEYENGVGSFPETGSLTDARLGSLLGQIKGIIGIYEDLKDEAQRRLHRGGEVPGFHLVNYQPPRVWKEKAAERLPNSGATSILWTEPKLLSPTQALGVLKAEKIEDTSVVENLIDKPAVRPVVAPVTDRRKAWEGVPPEQMFKVEQ
jgi:hypothetical protein